ncbi:hypothetical protein Vadar_010565 [Vaccinium darrowii]|uniref:Uncharacterized protein n=1 Tax=Vaccinium darrowii TaxID=229202 RepID=A0ACB7Z331_9ERIC|nr:hypothetical protein Vadar_010565 [Vaccinium darrowii]
MVLQNTAFVGFENHPMHLHGFNFHVLAQGFGNYNPVNGPKQFNLVNPQIRNTIGVPAAGWAVIRFTANNPVALANFNKGDDSIDNEDVSFPHRLLGRRLHTFCFGCRNPR